MQSVQQENSTGHALDQDFLKALSVLYVEDEDDVRELLTRYLKRWVGALQVATNGREGVELFRIHQPDVVITDIKMPLMDGLDMAAVIKATAREVPIVVITAYSERDYFMRAIEIGIDRYVTKPVNTDALLSAIQDTARERFHQRELERSRHAVEESLQQTIAVVARAIEARDPYTDGHQKRVSQLAEAIAEVLGFPPDQRMGIRLGSLIHDVGKIRVPIDILNLPRKLQPIEFEMIRIHPRAGYEILADTNFPWPVDRMVLEHHERMDGSGYPSGLKGEAICREARILAIADVVEAMSSHRPFRPALGIEAAVEEIRARRGELYDSEAVDACLVVLQDGANRFWK